MFTFHSHLPIFQIEYITIVLAAYAPNVVAPIDSFQSLYTESADTCGSLVASRTENTVNHLTSSDGQDGEQRIT